MEIRQIVRGADADFAQPASRTAAEKQEAAASARPAVDKLEVTRQWVEQMEAQNARIQALLTEASGRREEKSQGLLDMLDGTEAETDELDAMAEDMKVKMKCLEIAMRMMKGKKVPPEDERYLMENDPEGYKIAIAMKAFVKEDDEECESVLDDEDKNGGTEETSESDGEPAPAESAPSGGEAASSGGGESPE